MQRTRRNEQVSAGRGPGTRQQRGVDDGRQDGDPRLLDGDDKGALGGGGRQVERRVGRGDQQADDEGAAEVEDDEPEPDALDSLGHRATRVRRLGRGDGGDLGADEGEGGVHHDAEEGQEAAFRPGDAQVLHEAPRLPPVPEPDGLVVGAPARADDNAREDQAHNRHDLDGRKPKLHLAVRLVAAEVDGVHHDQHQPNPHCVVADARRARAARVARPVRDEHDGGRDLGGEHDDVAEPVHPAHGEAQLSGDIPRRQGELPASHGELRDHLAQDDHDREEERGHDEVAKEETARPAVLEVVGRAEEETGSDDTTDGDHLPRIWTCEQRGASLSNRPFCVTGPSGNGRTNK